MQSFVGVSGGPRGAGCVGRPDGKFARYAITDKVVLETDCLGAGAVYYTEQNGKFYFGSHLGLLLEALPQKPSLNQMGVASQLYARAQLMDETHFEGVYRLPAGSTLTYDGAISIERGSIRDLLNEPAPKLTESSLRDMIDEGVERESFDIDAALMLSGGKDSYAIALSPSMPKNAASYGESYSLDFRLGKRRASRLGLNFQDLPYKDWTLETYRDVIVRLHAGCSGLQVGNMLDGFARLKASKAAVGFLGDVLTGAHLHRLDGADSVRRFLLIKQHDPVLNDLYPEERKLLGDYVMDSFSQLAEDVGPERAFMILDLQWRQARWISMTCDLCDWYVPSAYPFFQKKLIASCLQADIADLKDQRLYRRLLGEDDNVLDRVMVCLGSAMRGKRVFTQMYLGGTHCNWPALIKRSSFDPDDYVCADNRLTDVTRRSWDRVLAGEDRNPVPVAYASAPIAAATRDTALPRQAGARRPDALLETESQG